jgi:GntR family histidine utilization transcriptional repressor
MKDKPLHERIRCDIEGQILSGAVRPGDRIPSELELMEVYGCSRMTVNKALSRLSHAGLVQRRKRAGTVVAERPTELMVLDVPDLPHEIARRGQTYGYALVERLVRAPTHDGEEQLLAGGGKLLFLRGVHLADGVPFACEERLVSLNAVPEMLEADFASEPPGSWLLRHIPWTEAENRIGALAASPRSALLLGVAPGAACLKIERRTWRGAEHITFVRQLFVAGQYELAARFGAVGGR